MTDRCFKPYWYPYPFLLLLALSGCGGEPGSTAAKGSFTQVAEQQSVAFKLPDLAGHPHSLGDYLQRGPVVLVFFTTWCPYCRREIPALKQVHAEYARQGLTVVAINAGFSDSLDNAKAYALQHRLPYVVLYDAEARVAAEYGVRMVPQIVYIRRDGRIAGTSRKVSTQAIEGLL